MYTEENESIARALETTAQCVDSASDIINSENPDYQRALCLVQLANVSALMAISSQLDILISVMESK